MKMKEVPTQKSRFKLKTSKHKKKKKGWEKFEQFSLPKARIKKEGQSELDFEMRRPVPVVAAGPNWTSRDQPSRSNRSSTSGPPRSASGSTRHLRSFLSSQNRCASGY